MAVEAILAEVDQLNQVGKRIEGLAEAHPSVSEALFTIAGNVRSSAHHPGVAGGDEASRWGWTPYQADLIKLKLNSGSLRRRNSHGNAANERHLGAST